MSIDSIKSKPTKKSPRPLRKEKVKPKKSAHIAPAVISDNRKKMWGFTIVSLILIVGLWIVSLKANIERINEAQSLKKSTNEISSIMSRFNEIFKQTSELVGSISLNTSTAQDIIDLEKSTTTQAELTEEQIKELSEKIKNIIPTSTPDNTQL